REYARAHLTREYPNAAEIAFRFANEHQEDKRLRGWFLQLAARARYQAQDPNRADELQRKAFARANALKSLSQHHLEQVLGIQCTGEAFAGQTLLAGVLPQEIERDVAQHGKVLGTVVLAEPTLIFPKGDIERPMEPVLNAPVVAHGAGKLLCVRFQASEVEALLYRSLPG